MNPDWTIRLCTVYSVDWLVSPNLDSGRWWNVVEDARWFVAG